MSIVSKVYQLCPNSMWHPDARQPRVTASCLKNFDELEFTFSVTEPPECFRLECRNDGDPCWQDSCVEVFIHAPALGGYFNFETNAAGRTLAEFGASRHNRRRFEPAEYHSLHRNVLLPVTAQPDGMVKWVVQIRIPLEKLHLSGIDPIVGNLYKCGSCAQIPSYLCAFGINTPSPDFHRPEYFKNLFI